MNEIELPEGYFDEICTGENDNKRFTVDSDAKADWAVKKIGEEQAEFERLKELAELNISRLKERIEKEKEQFERRTSYLTALLEEYFETVPPNRLNKAATQESYKLLSGKLVRKYPSREIKYKDDDLVEFLKTSAPEYIKTEQKPMWGEYKKTLTFSDSGAVTADGELVPCITVTTTPEKFEVKPDKIS